MRLLLLPPRLVRRKAVLQPAARLVLVRPVVLLPVAQVRPAVLVLVVVSVPPAALALLLAPVSAPVLVPARLVLVPVVPAVPVPVPAVPVVPVLAVAPVK